MESVENSFRPNSHLGTRERSFADMLDGSRTKLGVDGGSIALLASDDDSWGPVVGTRKPDSDAGWLYADGVIGG